ncbi:hypothetical protein [Kitasatospora aureofaciens]|nr:hypothetical protein [Kitasatospora aureofaciens]
MNPGASRAKHRSSYDSCDRINLFKKFVGVLGTNVGGGNISC